MRVGIAADHGGFELKVYLTAALKAAGYEVVDFGAHELVTEMTTRILWCLAGITGRAWGLVRRALLLMFSAISSDDMSYVSGRPGQITGITLSPFQGGRTVQAPLAKVAALEKEKLNGIATRDRIRDEFTRAYSHREGDGR